MRLSSRHRTAALLIQQGLHMCRKRPMFFDKFVSLKCLHGCQIWLVVEAQNIKFSPKNECFFKIFHKYRIKYTDEMKCINHAILLGIGSVDYESYRLS